MNEDAIKAELIRMRKYVIHHGVMIGECVAWGKLKEMFGVGIRDKDDWDWLKEYEAKQSLTEKLDCGCTVTKGWRCQAHGDP